MAKIKLGERVTITVNKQRPARRRPAAATPEPHYGPLVRIEDEPAGRRHRATFNFVDMSSVFISRNVSFNGRKLFAYTQHYGNVGGLAGTFIQSPFLWTRAQLESELGKDTIGGASISPQAVAVEDVPHGVYRKTFERWPMPFAEAEAFALTFVLGSSAFPLQPATDKWQERPITNPVEIDEQAAPWELSDSSDTTSDGNLWHTLFQTWWKNYGQVKLRPAGRRLTWRLDTDGVSFEPFDPFDADNFKCTEGAYADPEVGAPRIDASRRDEVVSIGLVPRFWTVAGGFSEWMLRTGNPLYKRTATFEEECLGVTCPYVDAYSIDDEPINEADYTVGTLSPVSGIFNDGSGHFPTTASFTAAFDGLPPAADPFAAGSPSYADEHSNFLMWMMSVLFFSRGDGGMTFSGDYPIAYVAGDIIERTDAVLDIDVGETPIGALVGRVLTRTRAVNVYRRTALPGGTSIYSGGFDSLGIGSPWGNAMGGTYNNSYFNSFARTHGDYDPLGLVSHVTI